MNTMNGCIAHKINEQSFAIKSGAKTDFFIDNLSGVSSVNAPFYFETIGNNFIASVKITPEFKATYDAGGLLVFDDNKNWIKAAFELTDLGCASVVTVVTDDSSDDCNGESIAQNAAWVRIMRKNQFWSIHYSLDGLMWKMVRYFELSLNRNVNVGVISQSPLGNGCRVVFSDFIITENNCKDLRKGT
jgi:regulation of enolase protein 1 (concanavalin A-like superfamily)